MNNTTDILKALVIYAICVPLALILGYQLTDPQAVSTRLIASLLTLLLAFPLMLRWQHPMMFFSWNMSMVFFFLPGSPPVWLLVAGVGLGIAVLQWSLGKTAGFISVPQVTWPLIFIIVVVLYTGQIRGWGLHNIIGGAYGGKRYLFMLGAIMGYFVLLTRRIPLEHAKFYVGLMFLPGLVAVISDMWPLLHWQSATFIFLLFPPDTSFSATDNLDLESTRLQGGAVASWAVFAFMMAKYGIRGTFISGRHWRWMVLFLATSYGLLSGFRSIIFLEGLTFALLFFLEGLHRTKYLFIIGLAGVLGMAALVPLAPHLPLTAQRAVSFLPLDIDPVAQNSADESWQWRVDMWKAVLPEVPQYLLLGKGYVISELDYQELMGSDAAIHSPFAEDQALAVSDDFHSGPLGLLLIFGIFGTVAFAWFLWAGIWVLYRNYRYGDPALRTVNAFLLAAFVTKTAYFFTIFGAPYSDMLAFCGWLGLGISLNGGVCGPSPRTVSDVNQLQTFRKARPQLQAAFQQEKFRA